MSDDAVREKLVEVVARGMCHEDGSDELIVDGMKVWQLRWDDAKAFLSAIEAAGYRIVPVPPDVDEVFRQVSEKLLAAAHTKVVP